MKHLCKINLSKITDETELLICGKRISIDLPSVGIAVYALFIITQPWLACFMETRAVLHIAIVFLALVLLSVDNIKGLKLKDHLSKVDLFWILAFALIVVYIFLGGIAAYKFDLFYFTVGTLFLLLAKAGIERYHPAMRLLKIGAIVYASGSILQHLFTDSFNRLLFVFASTSSQIRIAELVSGYYYPGFGFGSPATAAAYMVVGLGIIFAFWSSRTKQGKIVDGFLITLMFIGLLATGKRSILIWAVAALYITYNFLITGKKNRQLILAISLLLAILIFLYVLPMAFDEIPIFQRFASLVLDFDDGEAPGSVALRLRHYQDAWNLFLENPLFGVGWRQFIVLTSGFYPRGYSVHNVYLQLLSEMGTFGFIIIMLPIIYGYIRTYQVLKSLLVRRHKLNPLWKAGMTFSFYFQTFFLLYCLTENPFYNIIYMLLYFLAVSLLNAYIVIEKDCFRI